MRRGLGTEHTAAAKGTLFPRGRAFPLPRTHNTQHPNNTQRTVRVLTKICMVWRWWWLGGCLWFVVLDGLVRRQKSRCRRCEYSVVARFHAPQPNPSSQPAAAHTSGPGSASSTPNVVGRVGSPPRACARVCAGRGGAADGSLKGGCALETIQVPCQQQPPPTPTRIPGHRPGCAPNPQQGFSCGPWHACAAGCAPCQGGSRLAHANTKGSGSLPRSRASSRRFLATSRHTTPHTTTTRRSRDRL